MTDIDDDEVLLCEGYLRKIRGWGQNRTRWFRLTTKQFAFFAKDAGELLSSCARDGIKSVVDMPGEPLRFQIETIKPFGRTDNRVMVLEAPTAAVKIKWLDHLQHPEREVAPVGMGVLEREAPTDITAESATVLLIEGYLTKLQQSLTALSRMRWFVFTSASLAYYEEEGGALIAHCPNEKLIRVAPLSPSCFEVEAAEPFTKTGATRVELQCRDEAERDKWLQQMKKGVPDKVFLSEFTPLPSGPRPTTDHYAVVVDGDLSQQYLAQQRQDVEHSQGNRFISDGDL